MSGVCGSYRVDGEPVDEATLAAQHASLAHRGPDGGDVWREGPVGLGHQRLVTTPEAEGQPVVDDATACVLAGDLRVDNRAALLDELGLPENTSDARLVLAAYDRWGLGYPEHLVGAFAVAIWDPRAPRLVLARDHLGVKPLYYHRDDAGVVFGSEPKAVLAVDRVDARLDEVRVADHLVGSTEDVERTFYRGVRRLPPAHVLAVSPDGVERHRYWSLDPDARVELADDEAYADAFRERFLEAVRCRLRSPGPVGSMLSGGLDSSSIACAARELLDDDRPLHTVSAVFEDVPACDEREYIDAVLANGDFEAHDVHGDRLSPLVDLDEQLHHLDEPIGPPNHFLHWGLYREASSAGVRVLLDGIDGDTTVSHGRGHMAALARRGRWLRLAREVEGFAANFDRSRREVLLDRVLGPLAPWPVRRLWRWAHGREGPVERAVAPLDATFVERLELRERLRRELDDGGSHTAHEHHHRELTSGLVPHTFEVADRAAAAFDIEPRYPFFDVRLVEFCLALPTDQKIRRGWTRLVLRHAMDGILPEAIRWRGGKADLGPNFRRALLRYEGERLSRLLDGSSAGVRAYFDTDALHDALSGYRAAPQAADLDDVMALWRAASLGAWLRRAELEQ